jgi:hypothetical protein
MNLYIGMIFEGLSEAFVNVRAALRPSRARRSISPKKTGRSERTALQQLSGEEGLSATNGA